MDKLRLHNGRFHRQLPQGKANPGLIGCHLWGDLPADKQMMLFCYLTACHISFYRLLAVGSANHPYLCPQSHLFKHQNLF
jgi:hypothetical protein